MYTFDNWDNALVISGWEKGIADSELEGISNMRNANIISVPGEASVNFATAIASSPTISGNKTVTGLSSSAISFSGITGLENGMAIVFSAIGGLTGGIAINTTYWVYSCSGTPTTSCKLYTVYSGFGSPGTPLTITGAATGSPTFSIVNIATPNYFAVSSIIPDITGNSYASFMQDSLGQCWSTKYLTASGYWTYMGLSGTSDTIGRGLAIYKSTKNNHSYLFSFLDKSIDYFDFQNGVWVWGWVPSASSNSNHQTNYLNVSGIHEAFVAPNNRLYFCDGTFIQQFYEANPATDFLPSDYTTYIYSELQLLPGNDVAQCLAYLGTNLLIGGMNNIIYPWDTFDIKISYPILVAEFNIQKMLTINTNTYALVGNRGRIYITNGTNAQLYKKIPDHISGTVEPYFQWGGIASTKNQLYIGVSATTNGGTAINEYGGLWAIDIDTEAMRLTNQLSYGTYAGIASALIPIYGTTGHPPGGTGLYIGWSDGSNTNFGIDTTVATPYTGSQCVIDSDLIPIGTFNKTRDATTIEYKLTKPMVSGESITIKTRLIFDISSTGYSTTLTDNTVGAYSGTGSINFQNAQWVQFQIILNSTASSPSYTRLQQIRLLGFIGQTLAQAQQLEV